jgi:hypothetical protein
MSLRAKVTTLIVVLAAAAEILMTALSVKPRGMASAVWGA